MQSDLDVKKRRIQNAPRVTAAIGSDVPRLDPEVARAIAGQQSELSHLDPLACDPEGNLIYESPLELVTEIRRLRAVERERDELRAEVERMRYVVEAVGTSLELGEYVNPFIRAPYERWETNHGQ